MQRFSKKFLAILLTLCMLMSFAPMGVLAAEANAEVVNRQILLGDDLSMHFYTKVENASNATAVISVGGIERAAYSLAAMTAGENGYDFSVSLAPAEMTETVSLVVLDGETQLLQNTYSIREYALYLLENNYTDETKAMTKELLNYGAKAQLYFGHKTDALANEGYVAETAATFPAEIPEPVVTDTLTGINFYGAALVFDAKIAVRFYFAAENGVQGYTFAVEGKQVTDGEKNGMYYIEVADIEPDEMATALNVSVTKDAEALTFSYSPNDYLVRMYNNAASSQTLKDLLVAAYGYFEAAKVFSGVAENRTGDLTLAYRYGTNNLIQVNTNLPSDTPCVNFTAGENGCSIDESANQYQNVGWIGMDNVDGTIVLTFHFNAAFEAGQTYVLSKGSVFGFTDNSKYTLDKDYTFTFDGSGWTMEAAEPAVTMQYRWGNANTIQYNTDLPATTPLNNFLATDNGCALVQSGDQAVGWIGMANANDTIVLTFNFNAAFDAGQSYTLSAGSVFGFTDGSKYQLNEDVTLYWDGSAWTAEEPAEQINLQYRWGNANTIQYNTDLPATTPCVNFTASDNGSNLIQTANQYQNVGWIGMENVDGVIVLTFHFNASFAYGQSYILSAGSVFGFTDGSKYQLNEDVTLYWDGSAWVAEEPPKLINLQYRWGNANTIQYNTDLPATTPCANFTASDNGSNLIQTANQYQNVGWIGMENVDGVIVLTFHFNASFAYGQSYILSAGSVFGFTDGSKYQLNEDVTLYWDEASWGESEPAPQKDPLEAENFTGGEVITFADVPADFTNADKIQEYKELGFNTSLITEDHIGSYGVGAGNYYNVSVETVEPVDKLYLQYHYGAANLIQIKTNLPLATPTANFTTGDNGCNVIQDGAQVVGWIQMNGLVGDAQLLTFHFNSAFEAGQTYTLRDGSVFGFTDGSSYVLGGDYTFTFDGSSWTMTAPEGAPAAVTPITEKLNFQYRYGTSTLIQVNTDLPASTPIQNFLATDNGCSLIQSGDQQLGWAGMASADGTIVLTFNFNNAFQAGQSYTLAKGSVFGFTDGKTYTLDEDYTFTFDGSNWNMSTSKLSFSVNYVNGSTIQLKTSIPTGLTYGDFLLGDTSKGNVILESSEGAQAVGWFGYGIPGGADAVYWTFNFNGYNKPGAQYVLKAGTSLIAGDKTFTTDRDYILTVNNAYLSSIENLDRAGLDIWVRNFTNKTGYFGDAMTKSLLLYKDVVDGFYIVDEAFQNSTLLAAAGQQDITTDISALSSDLVGWFNTNFAGKYLHANHVPINSYDHYTGVNGETLSQLDVAGYRNFLQEYKTLFNDQVTASGSSIGFDNYPFVREQTILYSGISEDYLLNGLIAAQVAGQYDLSMCVQTFEASGKKLFGQDTTRDITSAAEVSLQLNTGFALGTDVFEYFAYNTAGQFNTIMNADGSKRIYDIVKEGNQALCFADVVGSFTWNGIVTSAGTNNNHNSSAFTKVEDMVLTNVSNGVLNSYTSTDDAIIGCFTKDALNGYMIVNFNDPKAVTGDNTVNVSFENCTRARVYTEVDGVLTSEVVELTNGSYTETLAPGAACFIIPA